MESGDAPNSIYGPNQNRTYGDNNNDENLRVNIEEPNNDTNKNMDWDQDKGIDQNYWELLGNMQKEGREDSKILGDHTPLKTNKTLFNVTRELSQIPQSVDKTPSALKYKFVIFPDNKWALRWDLWIMILIVFTIFQVPFQIGVSAGALAFQQGAWFIFFAFINWCFVADTILNFFRVTHDSNMNMVISLKRIRQAYLKGWFTVDALACFPSDLIVRYAKNETVIGAIQILNLLRIFRVLRLNRIIHNSHRLLLWRLRVREWKIAGLKLIFYVLIFNHWVACILSWMALLQAGSFEEEYLYNPETPNWMQSYHNSVEILVYPYSNSTWTVAGNDIGNIMGRYILSFYWSVMTTTSIGYGDVTATTFPEYWVVSFVMLLSGCFWAFFLARAIDVANKATEEKQNYWSRLGMANNIVSKFNNKDSFECTKYGHKVGYNFKSIVEKELVLYVYKQHYLGLCHDPELPIKNLSEIMHHLPRFLRDRVCLALIQRDLHKLSWFQHSSIALDTLAGIASLCEIHQFDAKERIHFTKDSVKRGIYIMRRGIIAYKEKNDVKRIDRVYCSDGVLFKEFAVFKTGEVIIPTVTLSMLTWTEMIFIPRKALKALFRVHPEIWQDHGRWSMLHGGLKYWARQRIVAKSNPFVLYFESDDEDSN